MPIDENICDLKMTNLAEQIKLMLKPIADSLTEIKGDMRTLKEGAVEYVLRREFEAKCREIEGLKKWVWTVSGGIGLASFLLGFISRFIK